MWWGTEHTLHTTVLVPLCITEQCEEYRVSSGVTAVNSSRSSPGCWHNVSFWRGVSFQEALHKFEMTHWPKSREKIVILIIMASGHIVPAHWGGKRKPSQECLLNKWEQAWSKLKKEETELVSKSAGHLCPRQWGGFQTFKEAVPGTGEHRRQHSGCPSGRWWAQKLLSLECVGHSASHCGEDDEDWLWRALKAKPRNFLYICDREKGTYLDHIMIVCFKIILCLYARLRDES